MPEKTHSITHQYSAHIPNERLFLSDEDSLLLTYKSYDMFVKNYGFQNNSYEQLSDVSKSKFYLITEKAWLNMTINYKKRTFDVEITGSDKAMSKNQGNIADIINMTNTFFNKVTRNKNCYQDILIMDEFSDDELDFRENNIN